MIRAAHMIYKNIFNVWTYWKNIKIFQKYWEKYEKEFKYEKILQNIEIFQKILNIKKILKILKRI